MCELRESLQVAMEKSRGSTVKAIELLRTYLDTFMTDKEAWIELADLYLEVSQHRSALSCCRECGTKI